MRRRLRLSRASPFSRVVLLAVVALLPVALLAVISIAIASNQVTRVVDKQVQTTAAVSSVVVGQQTTNLVELVHSFATRPALVAGMGGNRDENRLVDSTLALALPIAPSPSG